MENADGHPPAALTGYRVLDLCHDHGMLCTKIMADLGADVITIEPPAGMVTRARGPFYHASSRTRKEFIFWYFHTNKRSITLNLDTPEVRRCSNNSSAPPMCSWKRVPPALSPALAWAMPIYVPCTPPRHDVYHGLWQHWAIPSLSRPGHRRPGHGGLLYLCGEPDGPLSRLAGNKGSTWRPQRGHRHVDRPVASRRDGCWTARRCVDASGSGQHPGNDASDLRLQWRNPPAFRTYTRRRSLYFYRVRMGTSR